jgi:hypothetical protein
MEDTRVAYIAGAGRSGSTVLAMLLGTLPGFESIGELRHLWRRGVQLNQLCGCGAAFWDCPFWSEVGERAFGGWDQAPHERMLTLQRSVDRFRQLPKLAALSLAPRLRSEVEEYAGVAGVVYRAVAGTSGCHTVVDSSKSATFALVLRRVPGVRPFLIHLVRDSRAVAYSWTRLRPMPEVGGAENMATFGPLRSALVWAGNNAALDAINFRGRSARIMYESLVTGDPGVLDRLARALELGSGGASSLAGPTVPIGVQHAVAGNPARFARDSVVLRPDEEWRSAMSWIDRQLVVSITWPLLAKYGYAIRG